MPLLTTEQINLATDAAIEGGLADGVHRAGLLDGVNPRYRAMNLQNLDQPGLQIRADLQRMSDVEQLADGSVPLQTWLQNALYFTRDLANPAKTFMGLLAIVNAKASGQPHVDVTALPETKERIIHRDERLPFGFLAAGVAAGASVARLAVPVHVDGEARTRPSGVPKVFVGTGWLLTKTLLITNHHVINAREDHEGAAAESDFLLQAKRTVVEFDYDFDSADRTKAEVAEVVIADPVLDFAVLALTADTGRPALTIRRTALEQAQDDYVALNIIQHPAGAPKRIAIRNNLLTRADATTLRYFTDTSGGASGSPVLLDDWTVVALHRASTPVANVSFQGRTTAWVNVGTQISAILAYIAQNNGAIAKEIEVNGQVRG